MSEVDGKIRVNHFTLAFRLIRHFCKQKCHLPRRGRLKGGFAAFKILKSQHKPHIKQIVLASQTKSVADLNRMNELRPFIRRKISFRKTQCVFRKKLHFSHLRAIFCVARHKKLFLQEMQAFLALPALKSKKTLRHSKA
jgi:hypothetical protein